MNAPAVPPMVRTPRWRRLASSPVVWAIVLLAAVVPWALTGAAMEFLPFLLMLVGGWLCGFAFVGATFRISPPRRGALLHAVGAVLSAALVVVAVEYGGDLLASAPRTARALFTIVQMASIPAAGWIWIVLLGRGVHSLRRRSSTAAPVAPAWERNEHGDGSLVRFLAVPMRMRAISMGMALIIIVVGLGGTILLFAFGDVLLDMGPRLVVTVVGVVVVLPVYLVFTALVKRRSLPCTVGFGRDTLRVDVGSRTYRIPVRDIECLIWRIRSDYARIEVRAPRVDISLIVGLARQEPGIAPELPELPRRVLRMLELAGFETIRSRGGELVTSRPVEASGSAGQRSRRATTAR